MAVGWPSRTMVSARSAGRRASSSAVCTTRSTAPGVRPSSSTLASSWAGRRRISSRRLRSRRLSARIGRHRGGDRAHRGQADQPVGYRHAEEPALAAPVTPVRHGVEHEVRGHAGRERGQRAAGQRADQGSGQDMIRQQHSPPPSLVAAYPPYPAPAAARHCCSAPWRRENPGAACRVLLVAFRSGRASDEIRTRTDAYPCWTGDLSETTRRR